VNEQKLKILQRILSQIPKGEQARRSVLKSLFSIVSYLGMDPVLIADLMAYTIEIASIVARKKTK